MYCVVVSQLLVLNYFVGLGGIVLCVLCVVLCCIDLCIVL